MSSLVDNAVWPRLEAHARTVADQRMADFFAADSERARNLSLEACGLLLDISKQRLTSETLALLLELAECSGLQQFRRALFAGEPVNRSEDRAAWHVALRDPQAPAEVSEVLERMQRFVESVHGGRWTGFRGDSITDVVNIGIGGSDLGPRMVCRALQSASDNLRCHFVANVDPADLDQTLTTLDPATTLFVVTSKSFTTAETLANARAARAWLLGRGALQADIARHFVAVSTNSAEVRAFGIDTDNMFGFWDWVGGRFSLWSAVGLSIALAQGMPAFRQLLAGAHAMDQHFAHTPFEQNLPVWMALTGIWNRNLLGLSSLVVAPYAEALELFPSWLQQLEMESNGKSVTQDGRSTGTATVPCIWGSVGTNAQHAYFQMLHQGSDVVPVDFILPLPQTAMRGEDDRGLQLAANCLAQSEALMNGRSDKALREQLAAGGMSGEALERAAAQRRFEGNRPSSTILLPCLDAWHLGVLLAAYEHKTFVQGVLWGVNSFDQWGVELGKQLALQILQEWEQDRVGEHDASTRSLMRRVREHGAAR